VTEFFAQHVNTIVWQRTLTGTHKVDMQGIPPSGKKVKRVDMVVTRFNNEKIAKEEKCTQRPEEPQSLRQGRLCGNSASLRECL